MAWENLPSTNTPLNATNLNQFDVYSASETVIGKWIDNKIIYRKVINIGTLPNATYKDVSSGLTATDVTIIRMQGMAKASNGTQLPLPYATTTEENCVALSLQATGNLRIEAGIDRSAYTSSYVVLEYTKNS